MPSLGPNQTKDRINILISSLVTVGLAKARNYAFQRSRQGLEQVTFRGANYVSEALKNKPYGEIYDTLLAAEAYNAIMFDGALIQMMYTFDTTSIRSHRLAIFPSPSPGEFVDEFETHMSDTFFSDAFARNSVAFPFRFDFDSQAHQDLVHPRSHMTLGQYENCRIPVTAPLTPSTFLDFVLRNFYHAAFERHETDFPTLSGSFRECISSRERRVMHIVIPAT